jgi:hypothetical protein
MGMLLFPSFNKSTDAPLMASAVEFATSAFDIPTTFARSGSIWIFTCGLSGDQSSRMTAIPGDCCSTSIACVAIPRQGLDVRRFILSVSIGLTRDENFDWSLDWICLELADGDPCAGDLLAKG